MLCPGPGSGLEPGVTGIQKLPGDGCADWSELIQMGLVPGKEHSAGHHEVGGELSVLSRGP